MDGEEQVKGRDEARSLPHHAADVLGAAAPAAHQVMMAVPDLPHDGGVAGSGGINHDVTIVPALSGMSQKLDQFETIPPGGWSSRSWCCPPCSRRTPPGGATVRKPARAGAAPPP